ncbi:MAG: integrase, partial [candidate division Zixibacteria bacterium]|nr:integrase [candidate division Zixibacteria bacterium]
MGGDSRREYLIAIQSRYLEASKKEKSLILQEFCEVCKYHRKHAIRLLNQQKRRPTKRPGRKPIYCSAEFMKALKRIWLVSDQMCSKRLVAAIPL